MYVIKRDGTVKDFDISKIAAALEKAGKATGEFDAATANRITHIEVMNRLAQQNVATPTIEQIQDSVRPCVLILFTANSAQRPVMLAAASLMLKAL